jgi:hypothetical protein
MDQKYLLAEIHAMDKAVYIESEKVGRNLRLDFQGRDSQMFFIEWIGKHASYFNAAWKTSLCVNCKNVTKCYDCLKQECDYFEIFFY